MIDDPYNFLELDDMTRGFMLAELESDILTQGHPYRGRDTLSERGLEDYVALLRQAIEAGTEVDFVLALNVHDRIASPVTDAARKLGRTEFNRFYIRGICLRASAHDSNVVIVYRAHDSQVHRTGSDELVGQELFAPRILANVRGSVGYDIDSGIGRVNSGLSLRCGCMTCPRVARA